MSKKIVAIFIVLLHLWENSYAEISGDTLVLVDNLAIRETHSIFFRGLQGKKNAGEYVSTYVFAYDKD